MGCKKIDLSMIDPNNGVLHNFKNQLKFSTDPNGKTQDETNKIIDVDTNDVCVYLDPNPYIEIDLGGKYLFPTSYYMKGRTGVYMKNYPSTWKLEGITYDDKKEIINNVKNDYLNYSSERNIAIDVTKIKESYKAFRLTLLAMSSSNKWWLCFSKLEIFGYVFNKHLVKSQWQIKCTNRKSTLSPSFITPFIMILIIK